jgi:cysteine synthase A
MKHYNKFVSPIVKLSFFKQHNVYIQLEYLNIGRSIKYRVAFQMIKDLSKTINLTHKTILEASGGNTAIGLAVLSNYFNYRLTCVIPDNYPLEKISKLKLLGANIITSNHKKGLDSHIKKARELSVQNNNFIYVNQFENFSNVKAHYFGTAHTMVLNFNKIDYFITGIGSGGTITGVGKRLKEKYKTYIIGVLPKGYKIGNTNFNHKIFGIGIGVKSKILDLSGIDDYIYIEEKDLKEAMKIATQEGIFVGVSSLANIAAIKKLVKTLKKRSIFNKTILTVAPDEGDNYLNFLKEVWND